MFRSSLAVILVLLLTGASLRTEGCRVDTASGYVLHKNIVYAEEPGADPNLLSLDVYSPPSGAEHPVLVMVHGGGWTNGDKSNDPVGVDKGRYFAGQGYVYVSINYRLSPAVMHPAHVEDVARALAYVRTHIAQYGGDPDRIAVMGHSAGAHLAALVATDTRRLEAAGESTSILRGVILLDGAGYNIPVQMAEAGPLLHRRYVDAFGTDVAVQLDASPITHVDSGRSYPPFLILHVARREDSRVQSEALGAALESAGGEAAVVSAEGKTHMSLNRDIGLPGDVPTAEIMSFLSTQLP